MAPAASSPPLRSGPADQARQHREKTASHPGQGADHENQGEKATPQILESRTLEVSICAMSSPPTRATSRPAPRSPSGPGEVQQRLYLSRTV